MGVSSSAAIRNFANFLAKSSAPALACADPIGVLLARGRAPFRIPAFRRELRSTSFASGRLRHLAPPRQGVSVV